MQTICTRYISLDLVSFLKQKKFFKKIVKQQGGGSEPKETNLFLPEVKFWPENLVICNHSMLQTYPPLKFPTLMQDLPTNWENCQVCASWSLAGLMQAPSRFPEHLK